MSFCKVCACGEKIVFERRLSFPDNCPSCGRKLIDFLTYNEDDPRVEELIKSASTEESSENVDTVDVDESEPQINSQTNTQADNQINNHIDNQSDSNRSHKKKYVLKLNNGKEIEIPDEGGIVGRTEIGAEELAEFSSVSRQHLRVKPRRNIGVLIEDISTYGTFVDGKRIEKNDPVRIVDGSKVTLCNVDAVLTVKEVSD